jgi:hypothetical protein
LKKINFGPTSARDYFSLHVMPANTQFLNISNHENAMSLAKALWDTVGWLWSDRHPGVGMQDQPTAVGAFYDDLFKGCPDLKLFRDLAEAAKHGGELSRKSVKVTGISGCGSPGGTSFTSSPFGPMGERPSGPFGGMMVESTPECTLRIDYEGGSRDMKEALTAAYGFLLAGFLKR